jgi:hypothetical protein
MRARLPRRSGCRWAIRFRGPGRGARVAASSGDVGTRRTQASAGAGLRIAHRLEVRLPPPVRGPAVQGVCPPPMARMIRCCSSPMWGAISRCVVSIISAVMAGVASTKRWPAGVRNKAMSSRSSASENSSV